MKILISPAKKLNFEDSQNSAITSTRCIFLERSKEIMRKIKKLSPLELARLMKISEDLSELNHARNQDWNIAKINNQGKQALFSFQGAVYKAMKIEEFDSNDINFTNNHLRILSGLYGILKPSDLILPYRLEMGTKIQIGEYKDLYYFWRSIITSYFLEETKKDSFLINLASNEYFKVIDKKKITVPVITPVFKDRKNGKEKVISFYAKEARGAMCNYIIKNKISQYQDLKKFSGLNYVYSKNHSTEHNLVFTRNHN